MRSFIALEIPARARRAAALVTAELKPAGGQVKWVKPELMHLTLKFLGEVSPEQLPQAKTALADCLARESAPRIKLFGCGAFPSIKRPQVVWLGLEGEIEKVASLASRVEAAMVPLGFEPDNRGFKPHLTLGRVKGGRVKPKGGRANQAGELGRALAALAAWQGPEFVADRVALMRSTLTPAGPIYEPLQNYQLA